MKFDEDDDYDYQDDWRNGYVINDPWPQFLNENLNDPIEDYIKTIPAKRNTFFQFPLERENQLEFLKNFEEYKKSLDEMIVAMNTVTPKLFIWPEYPPIEKPLKVHNAKKLGY